MANISWNTFKDINSFNPNKYGGLEDMGLYINFHDAGLNGFSNNAIYKVGDSYYLVSTGDPKKKIDNNKVLKLIQNYDNRDVTINRGLTGIYKDYATAYPNAVVKQITDPNLIAQIQAKGSTKRNGREELAKYDDSTKSINYDNSFKYSINNDSANTQQTAQQESEPNGGGGYTTYYSPPPDYSYYRDRIKDLEAELAEVKRPKSGSELAEHYGIQDTLANRGYWAGIYADDLNQYYDDLINKQNDYRSRYTRNNATYDDYLEKEYINSYNNASNAKTTRGAVAANALSTGNVNDYNSSKNDINMMQNVNALNAQRIADLAGVDYKAEQTYANVMAKLMELGANHDASVVQDIVNSVGALKEKNAAEKAYAASTAAAANTAYSGLVNAKATANASTDELNALYNYYLGQTSGNKTQASNMMTNYWGRIGAGY